MKHNMHTLANYNKERIHSFLADRGVEQERLYTLNESEKLTLLCNSLIGRQAVVDANDELTVNVTPTQDRGLIIIKPEALPFYEQYVEFLETIKCTVEDVGDIVRPTHEQWMQQYGEVLAQYPRAIHSYVTQRALGVRVIRFSYSEQLKQSSIGDVNEFFDATYCGQSTQLDTTTLRGAVSHPLLVENGFSMMEGYAEPFDFAGYFTSGANEPMRTYNGVHIPSDRNEMLKNITTYCGSK